MHNQCYSCSRWDLLVCRRVSALRRGSVEVYGCQGIGRFGKASSYQGLEIGLEPVVRAKGFCERLPCRLAEFSESQRPPEPVNLIHHRYGLQSSSRGPRHGRSAPRGLLSPSSGALSVARSRSWVTWVDVESYGAHPTISTTRQPE